jgi:hypothetical protein
MHPDVTITDINYYKEGVSIQTIASAANLISQALTFLSRVNTLLKDKSLQAEYKEAADEIADALAKTKIAYDKLKNSESVHKESDGETVKKDTKCYKCDKTVKAGDTMYRWYHGDQDDLICPSCAGKTKHTDTGLAGTKVKEASGQAWNIAKAITSGNDAHADNIMDEYSVSQLEAALSAASDNLYSQNKFTAQDAKKAYSRISQYLASKKKQKESWDIEDARKVINNKSMGKVGGRTLDMQTANALVTVYDNISGEKKVQFTSMPIERAISVAWKLVG